MAGLFQTDILSRKNVTDDILELTLSRPSGFYFLPGQYIQLGVPKLLQTDPRGKSRIFSITSSPSDDKSISVAFRISDSGFKQTLQTLPDGAPLLIQGPHGHFVFTEEVRRPVVFVAGGIGITPFLSMVRYALDIYFHRQMFILYSSRDGAYLQLLRKLTNSRTNMHLITTKSRIDHNLIAQIAGEVGDDALWYIAGPPGMAADIRHTAVQIGVADDHLLTDEFIGY